MDAFSKTRREKLFGMVMQFADARLRGQFDMLEAIATEDVVVKLIGNRALSPFVGTFKGRQAGRAALENLSIEFEYRDVKMEHLMIDSDQVGMRWSGILKNRGTSAQAHFEGFIHVIFRGDQVCEYAAFLDTAAMAHLADWRHGEE